MGAEPSVPLFTVAAEAYDRLMGRYLPTLGVAFAAAAGVAAGQRVLDVGCGPGGLTVELVRRVGADRVSAIDPSAPFVTACRERCPGVEVREGTAERLPWDDETFDVVLGSLVSGFFADPVAAAAEMHRVARPGGRVALCFWDIERMPLLALFWRAVAEIDPHAPGEDERLGRRQGQLVALLRNAGLVDVTESVLTATGEYADVDDWWSSYTGGAGPVGAHHQRMTAAERVAVRERATRLLPTSEGPFRLRGEAWCAVGRVPIDD